MQLNAFLSNIWIWNWSVTLFAYICLYDFSLSFVIFGFTYGSLLNKTHHMGYCFTCIATCGISMAQTRWFQIRCVSLSLQIRSVPDIERINAAFYVWFHGRSQALGSTDELQAVICGLGRASLSCLPSDSTPAKLHGPHLPFTTWPHRHGTSLACWEGHGEFASL